ncbi:Ribonuclease H domain [Sesbania bispinosa]|nr:Ribonuclease H domain [Sesbania bispinosa]
MKAFGELKSGYSWRLGTDLHAWIKTHALGNRATSFLAGLWEQWCWRNDSVIGRVNRDINSALRRISFLELDWYAFVVNNHTFSREKKTVIWSHPLEGFIKLNTDGSRSSSSQRLGFGGVIRNDSGDWIIGFSGNGGTGYILKAELLAIFHGLSLSWDRGYRKIICESDSLEAAKLIGSATMSSFHEHAILLANIIALLQRDWTVYVKHTYREANFAADFFAKLGVEQSEAFKVWTTPPAGVSLALLSDASGAVHLR